MRVGTGRSTTSGPEQERLGSEQGGNDREKKRKNSEGGSGWGVQVVSCMSSALLHKYVVQREVKGKYEFACSENKSVCTIVVVVVE